MNIVDIAMTNKSYTNIKLFDNTPSAKQLMDYLNFTDHTDIKFLDYPPILTKSFNCVDDENDFSKICKQMGDIVKKSGVKVITLDSFSAYNNDKLTH